MRCLRCQGLLITIEMRDLYGTVAVPGWRCLLCGATTDPGIAANQAKQSQPMPSRARLPGSPVARKGHG